MKIMCLLSISLCFTLRCCLSDTVLRPYQLLYTTLINNAHQQCPCRDCITHHNKKNFFWLEKALENNDERLLFLLLNHPYKNISVIKNCHGFNPFLSDTNNQIVTLNSLEIELLKPIHTPLAKKMLQLWTTETEDNPFLEEWCLLLDTWRFQLQFLKCLEKIPFGQDKVNPFLKSTKDQHYQWAFWLRCYWVFLASHDNHLYNAIEKSFNKNKKIWPYEKKYIQHLTALFPEQINALSKNVKKAIVKHYKSFFDTEPQTDKEYLIFRGQTQSLFYSEKLINAYTALHI